MNPDAPDMYRRVEGCADQRLRNVDPGAALNVALQVDADVVPTAHKSVAAQLETGPPGSFLHRSNGFVIRLVEFALSIVVRIADVSDQGLRRRLPCERLDRAFFWAGFW